VTEIIDLGTKMEDEEKNERKKAQRVEEMSVAYTRSTSCARCLNEEYKEGGVRSEYVKCRERKTVTVKKGEGQDCSRDARATRAAQDAL